MPKVSVIIGIYNCENTLQEALDSLYTQTFKDFEIIMCDDCSTDNTFYIALKNQQNHDEFVIKLLKNEKNLGLNRTLNRCLNVADGEYIARMDGDDISLPNRFEKQVNFLDNNCEYGFVSSPMIYFDDKGNFKTGIAKEKPQKMDFVYNKLFCHAPAMVRKTIYEEVGGYSEDSKTLRVEDLDLWFRIYAAGYKGYNIQQPLYKMRDDRNALKRRKLKYRLNSVIVRLRGYNMLKIPFRYYPYCIIPILVGLIPSPLYKYLHRKKQDKP